MKASLIGLVVFAAAVCGCANFDESSRRPGVGPTTRPTKPVKAMADAGTSQAPAPQPPEAGFEVHDKRRPQPAVVEPGTFSTQEQPGKPPADAVVLFGGTDLSKWQAEKGGDAPWKVENGEMVIAPRSGPIVTRDQFRDVQ